MTASAAAKRLGISSQAVRDRLHAGTLRGHQTDSRRWRIDSASVEQAVPRDKRDEDLGHRVRELTAEMHELAAAVRELAAGAPRVNALEAAVAALTTPDAATVERLQGLERERDRYRSDASAVRAAALAVNAAASDLDGSVRQVLEVLAHQRDALTQLLAPGSPEDIT
jgi:excisionase family DNA binding protein